MNYQMFNGLLVEQIGLRELAHKKN